MKRLFTNHSLCRSVAWIFFAAFLATGCVVEHETHYTVTPTLDNPRRVHLGGMLTDQIISLWEEGGQDAADTLEILRALTDDSPIAIENPLLINKTTNELWLQAIQPAKRASFNAALRAVSIRVSDRALCIQLAGPKTNRRVAYWTWCPREFLGEPVKHIDQIETEMPRVIVAEDRVKFAYADSNQTFVPYGLVYGVPLLQGNWSGDDWTVLEKDFRNMKFLGTNVVRVHLQFGEFMDTPTKPNQDALRRLRRLLRVAEQNEIYLDITGLGCMIADLIPPWYDRMTEARRWKAQTVFWAAVARTCAASNAVFCYDLMNEPTFDGGTDSPDSPWLIGEGLGGYYFVQRITRDLNGRDRRVVAKAWIDTLVAAIRQHDPTTLVTVGIIPHTIRNPNANPVFYGNGVDENLDFVSPHVYPLGVGNETPEGMDLLLAGLDKYDIGKPMFIEETSSFRSGNEIWGEFLDRSTLVAEGWQTQFFGTPEELDDEIFLEAFYKYIIEFWISKQAELTAAVQ